MYGQQNIKKINTWWSKSLRAPDEYNTIVRCTQTFWSPCIMTQSRSKIIF